MRFVSLLKSNALSIYEKLAMKKKLLKKIITIKNQYSLRVVHQTILPGMHTSLTGVSTTHLNCGAPMVLPSSLFKGPFPLLISGDNLLALRFHNLESLSTLQEGGILYYDLVPELLDVLQLLPFFLLFHNPPSFSLFLCFGLHLSPCFLNYVFYITGLHCLF